MNYNFDTGLMDVNTWKNRYGNIVPREETRVKLSPIINVNGSDYINANWIDGLTDNSEKLYIATQGPLETTRFDFWKMIAETNSNMIIMLTKLTEGGKVIENKIN